MASVMGVLNITPDSFSDGGCWLDPGAAVAHAQQMVSEGADVVDVGGESTRPGALPVAEDEEIRRVIPVVEALATQMRVSVDTRKAAVAEAALAAGATMLNDVSASLWPVAAEAGAAWIAMHMPADPSVMAHHAKYHDVVDQVRSYLFDAAQRAAAGGVEEVWIDPGIGFAKTAEHNLSLLRNLHRIAEGGWPVLVGTSRKSFLGTITTRAGSEVPPAGDRLEASVATAAWALLNGAAMVRVHDTGAACKLVALIGSNGAKK